VRLAGAGFLFDVGGSSAFPPAQDAKLILGLLNCELSKVYLKIFNPTLNFQPGNLGAIPVVRRRLSSIQFDVEVLVDDAVAISRADWDNFETSWDFRDLPLLRNYEVKIMNDEGGESFVIKGRTLEESWVNWKRYCDAAIRRMQELETENNRLWIAAYGLEGELQPEVPEEQITLARADARRDVAAFLSYAVGCMMGRYSLAAPGLILADAGGTVEDYWKKVGQASCLPDSTNTGRMPAPHFPPDADGIIPVLEGEWFEDDIVARTREFLRVTFGEATLNENLCFIEKSLGKSLEKYFLNDFYKDHLQTYKNRPIYWLFSSGKEKAFQCLVYLHRYQPGTLARMRTEYVIPLQGKLAARIAHLNEEVSHATASSQRKKLQTELDKLVKQQSELRAFDEQLRHYADQRISLDLDDGVKVNYAKFGPLVAEAKKVCGKKEED
jgi:hypothetical protein